MREDNCTRVLGWPGYKVYRAEIDERAKRLKLWVRRKRGNKQLVCSGCGQQVGSIAEAYEREVRDLPCFECLTTVVIELYRLRCPGCGVKTEKVQLAAAFFYLAGDFVSRGRKIRPIGCLRHQSV